MERYGKEPQLVVTYPLLRRARRGGEDVEVPRQLHRDRRGFRRRSSARRCQFRTRLWSSGGSCSRVGVTILRIRWSGSSSSRAGSRPAGTARKARAPARRIFTQVVRRHKAPEEVPELQLPADGKARPSACSFEGAVRADDESLAPADRSGRGQGERRSGRVVRPGPVVARRRGRPGREAPIRARAPRLTARSFVVLFPGCPRGRCWKVPAKRPQRSSLRDERKPICSTILRPRA